MSEEKVNPIIMVMMESGEIVLTETKDHHKAGCQYFITPAVVSIQRTLMGQLGFVLQAWIPNELLNDTILLITRKSVRGVLDPAPALIEFYKSWAETEREKVELFSASFTKEISQIRKYHEDRHQAIKAGFNTQPHQGFDIISLSDELIAMFEENSEWGNPKISN